MVELPLEWAPGCADDLPPRFVTHQHLPPSESLVRWLVESRAVVLTTIRHPADTFLSYFHYVKWHDTGSDQSTEFQVGLSAEHVQRPSISSYFSEKLALFVDPVLLVSRCVTVELLSAPSSDNNATARSVREEPTL